MSESLPNDRPVVMELEPGDYWWCACGNSATAFCDGSHQGTGFQPLKFTVEETKQVALCQCKQTQGQPFCDGAHAKL